MYELGRSWNSSYPEHSEIKKQNLKQKMGTLNLLLVKIYLNSSLKFKLIYFFPETFQENLDNPAAMCVALTIGNRPFRLPGNQQLCLQVVCVCTGFNISA